MKRRSANIILLAGLLLCSPLALAEEDSNPEQWPGLALRAAELYHSADPAEGVSSEAPEGSDPASLFDPSAPLAPLPSHAQPLRPGAVAVSGEVLSAAEALPLFTSGAQYRLTFVETGARVDVRYVGAAGYAMAEPLSEWDAHVLYLGFGKLKSLDRKPVVLTVGERSVQAKALLDLSAFDEETALPGRLRLYFSSGGARVGGIESIE